MNITINLDAIIKESHKSQEHSEDFSFPFFEALGELYPQAMGYICEQMKKGYKPTQTGTIYFSYIDKDLNCLREDQTPQFNDSNPEDTARGYLAEKSRLFNSHTEFLKIDFIQELTQ